MEIDKLESLRQRNDIEAKYKKIKKGDIN